MEQQPKIILIDPGVSQVKGVSQDEKGRSVFLSMAPYCAEIDQDEAEHQKKMASDNLTTSTWVARSNKYYLLGDGAQKYTDAVVGNTERKHKKAFYQALGVVGYFAREFGLKNGDRISVGVLLPFSEYVTKDRFSESFKAAMEEFEFCGIKMSFELVTLNVSPEGLGLYLGGLPRTINAKEVRIACLVIGFRNATWLVNERGRNNPDESSTCNLGYRWFIEEVMSRTGHTDEMVVMRDLFTAEDGEIWAQADALLPRYWGQLQKWIQQRRPVDYIIVGGGTGLVLKPQIEATLPNAIWPNALLDTIAKHLPETYDAYRFADAYGVYKSMVQRAKAIGAKNNG